MMKSTILVPTITTVKKLAFLSAIAVFLLLISVFPVPAFAQSVPQYCTTTGSYQVCTDQADYSPTMTIHISGFNFAADSAYLIKVTRPDGSVVTGDGSFGPWPTAYDYTVADSNGNFVFDYVLDGILGNYTVEVLDSGNNSIAAHIFSDGTNKVGSVIVGPQTGALTQGTAGSVTYTVTVNRGTGGGTSGTFTADLTMITSLPAGATYSFSPSSVSFGSSDNSKTATLTISTTAATPSGTFSFTVKATRNDNPGDYATNDTGTLTIDIAPDTTPPVVTVPSDITQESSLGLDAAVSFSPAPTASDLVDGALTPTCVPASGSSFALGTTLVTCSATDGAGNTASASFSVTLQDTLHL